MNKKNNNKKEIDKNDTNIEERQNTGNLVTGIQGVTDVVGQAGEGILGVLGLDQKKKESAKEPADGKEEPLSSTVLNKLNELKEVSDNLLKILDKTKEELDDGAKEVNTKIKDIVGTLSTRVNTELEDKDVIISRLEELLLRVTDTEPYIDKLTEIRNEYKMLKDRKTDKINIPVEAVPIISAEGVKSDTVATPVAKPVAKQEPEPDLEPDTNLEAEQILSPSDDITAVNDPEDDEVDKDEVDKDEVDKDEVDNDGTDDEVDNDGTDDEVDNDGTDDEVDDDDTDDKMDDDKDKNKQAGGFRYRRSSKSPKKSKLKLKNSRSLKNIKNKIASIKVEIE